MVAFLGVMVFPNKERTIDIRTAKIVQILTTKENHTLVPIILSDIYRALTLCKLVATVFEGCKILLQMWLIEHLQDHPKFMQYGPSTDNFIESYEERIKYWLKNGAKPSDRITKFLSQAKIMEDITRDNPNKAKPTAKAQERAQAIEDATVDAEEE